MIKFLKKGGTTGMVCLNREDLKYFEECVFEEFNKGTIKGAIHLSGSKDGKQEDWLVDYFKKIKKNDWVFSTHRSHYHALLKSQDIDWVWDQIKDGNSMHINSEEHKIFTSSIVGGIIPIALGTALAMKRKNHRNHVYCFVGDMASYMGQFYEAVNYAIGHSLPITFIIENNDLGVYTPTKKVWRAQITCHTDKVIEYDYKRKYPHHGSGKFIHF